MVRLQQGLMLAGAWECWGAATREQGTAQVTPETRKALIPHAGAKAKDSKRQSVAGKSLSIKDRNPAAPSE